MHELGVHKQIVNRIIEPWCHINVVVSFTDSNNFYALRRHVDAQPEMKMLANLLSIRRLLTTGQVMQGGPGIIQVNTATFVAGASSGNSFRGSASYKMGVHSRRKASIHQLVSGQL